MLLYHHRLDISTVAVLTAVLRRAPTNKSLQSLGLLLLNKFFNFSHLVLLDLLIEQVDVVGDLLHKSDYSSLGLFLLLLLLSFDLLPRLGSTTTTHDS